MLAACSTSTPTGSLQITVSGLPSGLTGAVSVTGPGGYSKTVTATTTLSNLALGTYAVSAAAATSSNPIVGNAYDGSVSSSSVDVQQNTTASATVTYAARTGSGQLWVPQSNGSVIAASYSAANLAATGSPAATTIISVSSGGTAEGMAFDGTGNLWISFGSGSINRYAAASLGSTSTPTPSQSIDATAYGFVNGLAFDASGNLWAADGNSSQLLMYTPAQQNTGGALTPSVVLSATGSSIAHPIGIAFDSSGDLWVANDNSSTVVEFTPTQLAATGSPTPAVTISANSTPSLSSPFDIAFDAAGNLWVANAYNAPSVVRFSPSQLTTSGSPTPMATITSASAGTNPEGLALDASGALWVADYGAKQLLRFTNPATLSGTVSPSAAVNITGLGAFDAPLIAFSPPAANLPIQTP